MQIKNIIASQLVAVGLASALPQATVTATTPVATPSAFTILTLRSASDIHFNQFNAALSSVFLQLPKSNASCDATSDGAATFYLNDGGLFLYSNSNPPQQLYADRSGMGQGKFGYVTGAQPPPRNAELTGWGLDDAGNLNLDGAGFLACPNSIDDSWSVWVNAGVDQPAGNEGCLGFSARAVESLNPNACLYTQ
ncbi:cell wall protein PhiA [Ilyonectria robusta]|uniref:cell wall protein PhiA n=1 Tax=Ilyonectria robusta TaxID=1079257 RepID=UPI001E8DECD2|nr:cell wall protein PhiA [Ilyonectria robusta]KAH8729850.1 cell wall protein PhiA [Ilyonectria robusta]